MGYLIRCQQNQRPCWGSLSPKCFRREPQIDIAYTWAVAWFQHGTWNTVEWIWCFPWRHQCFETFYSILLYNYVYFTAACNQKSGALCEINNNHIVTSPFHYKTKQHRTSLDWPSNTVDRRLRSDRNTLWDWFVRWLIGKLWIWLHDFQIKINIQL